MARSLSRPASQPTALGFEDAIDAMDHPDGRDQAQPPFDGGDNDDAASQTRLTRQLMLSMQRERDDREQMTQEMDALRAELEATRMDMALLLENRDNLAAELQALQHVHRQALSSTMATPRADRVAASPSAYASEFGIDRHTPADDGDLYADVVADVDDDAAAHDAMRARLRREAAAFEVEMRQFEARRHASAEAQHREPQRDPRRGRAERSGPVHHDVASPFGEAANYTALDRPAARSMGSGTRRTRASSPSPSSHDDATPPMVPAPTSTFTSEFASAGVMATPSNKILRGLPDPFDTPVSRMADRLAVWSIAPPAA
ncbi:hypothetical protein CAUPRSCDRAFT_11754 [Caulochytrium protostelioides]|nr:hypothetical protein CAUPRSCDRAFT_11754 [Caulochytrium protostelioides]